jgi:hypothetical protein
MTSGSQECLQTPQSQKKPISAPEVLASQSEVALDRSEAFLRNQDPERPLGRSDRTDCLSIRVRGAVAKC